MKKHTLRDLRIKRPLVSVSHCPACNQHLRSCRCSWDAMIAAIQRREQYRREENMQTDAVEKTDG